MDCPACGTDTVVFEVPPAYSEVIQEPAQAAAFCPTCLTLTRFDGDAPPPSQADFSAVIESFPEGDAGAAMALSVGLLVDSLALNRDAVKTLFDTVSDTGEDPWLVLERLSVAGSVQPDADLSKIRHQLEQLWS